MHKVPWYKLPSVAALIALLVAWSGVIWVALHVSTIVLQTLEQIVDLAAISP